MACDQDRNKLRTGALPSCQSDKWGIFLNLREGSAGRETGTTTRRLARGAHFQPRKRRGGGEARWVAGKEPPARSWGGRRPSQALKEIQLEAAKCSKPAKGARLPGKLLYGSDPPARPSQSLPGLESRDSQAERNFTSRAKLRGVNSREYANFFARSSHSYPRVPL